MAKDFGDEVLPQYGTYMPTRQAPPTMEANWPDAMDYLLELRLRCVQQRQSPGWIQLQKAGILMLILRDSVMRLQWTYPALLLGHANETAANLTGIS